MRLWRLALNMAFLLRPPATVGAPRPHWCLEQVAVDALLFNTTLVHLCIDWHSLLCRILSWLSR